MTDDTRNPGPKSIMGNEVLVSGWPAVRKLLRVANYSIVPDKSKRGVSLNRKVTVGTYSFTLLSAKSGENQG